MANSMKQRDMQILSAAFRSIKGPVKIDYESLALLAGYKTAASASVSFGLLKKRLGLSGGLGTEGEAGPSTLKVKEDEAGDEDCDGAKEAKTATTPKKRGRKPQDDIDGDVAGTTPARKKRATKGIIDDGNGAVVKPTPKNRSRKPKLLLTASNTNPEAAEGGELFYSENDEDSDVNVETNVSKFNDDETPPVIKQEDCS